MGTNCVTSGRSFPSAVGCVPFLIAGVRAGVRSTSKRLIFPWELSTKRLSIRDSTPEAMVGRGSTAGYGVGVQYFLSLRLYVYTVHSLITVSESDRNHRSPVPFIFPLMVSPHVCNPTL